MKRIIIFILLALSQTELFSALEVVLFRCDKRPSIGQRDVIQVLMAIQRDEKSVVSVRAETSESYFAQLATDTGIFIARHKKEIVGFLVPTVPATSGIVDAYGLSLKKIKFKDSLLSSQACGVVAQLCIRNGYYSVKDSYCFDELCRAFIKAYAPMYDCAITLLDYPSSMKQSYIDVGFEPLVKHSYKKFLYGLDLKNAQKKYDIIGALAYESRKKVE